MDALKEQYQGVSEAAFILSKLNHSQSDFLKWSSEAVEHHREVLLTPSEDNLHQFSFLSPRHSKNGSSEVL